MILGAVNNGVGTGPDIVAGIGADVGAASGVRVGVTNMIDVRRILIVPA